MKPDIRDRADIETLINAFYDKVKRDDVIGFFFTEVVHVQWGRHLPVMYTFWENIVFHTGRYEGNPMVQHQHIHQKSAMTAAHFQRWILLFTQAVEELFEGEKAEIILQRATSIATVMQIKILH